MRRRFLLEYRVDDDWYVGRLKEVPGVFVRLGEPHHYAGHLSQLRESTRIVEDSEKA